MKNRTYGLVFLDHLGRPVRRMRVSRRLVRGVVIGCLATLIAGSAAAVDSWFRYDQAAETQTVAHSNANLRLLVHELETEIPAARRQAELAELAFSQLWAKSGLGVEERHLGMGPVEHSADTAENELSWRDHRNARAVSLQAVELPTEVRRLQASGVSLQKRLGETLEYFHDAQRLLSNTPSVRPARSPWVTSSFGRRRDPMRCHWMMHKGLDIGGYIGMPVFTPADGVVIWTGRRGGYGQTVVIDHGFGLQTHFAHLSAFKTQKGQHVARGDIIAEMGSTGKSTGPHLHYEVRRNGQPLDPRKFILD